MAERTAPKDTPERPFVEPAMMVNHTALMETAAGLRIAFGDKPHKDMPINWHMHVFLPPEVARRLMGLIAQALSDAAVIAAGPTGAAN